MVLAEAGPDSHTAWYLLPLRWPQGKKALRKTLSVEAKQRYCECEGCSGVNSFHLNINIRRELSGGTNSFYAQYHRLIDYNLR